MSKVLRKGENLALKINLPKHEIVETESVRLKDIPLSYVDAENVIYVPEVLPGEHFLFDRKEQVYAYQGIDDPGMFFFDGDGNILEDIELKRQGNTYTYEPQSSVEFTPTSFTCSAIVQRDLEYSSTERYGIRFGVATGTEDSMITDEIMQVLGDAGNRDICPSNILVNDGDLMDTSLSRSYIDSDFILVESPDGIHYGDTAQTEIPVETILQNHTNIWLAVNDFGDMIIENEKYTVDKNGKYCGFYVDDYREKRPDRRFDPETENESYPSYGDKIYSYTFMYDDVLLLRSHGNGYVIVTPREFVEDIVENAKVFYDVLMYVFLHSFLESEAMHGWIATDPVEYVSYTRKRFGKRQPDINLAAHLSMEGCNMGTGFNLVSVNISTPSVIFTGMDTDTNLFFTKTEAIADPSRSSGQVSFYTSKGTILFYEPEEVWTMETKARIDTETDSYGTITLTVYPLKSSFCHIFTEESKELVIPDNSKKYYVTALPTEKEIRADVELVEQNTYKEEEHGHIIASVSIKTEKEPVLYDLRIGGGGLPEYEDPDYDLVDIASIGGRPYRLGSVLVIRMPAKLKAYRGLVAQAIEKHMGSGDYPVLIFE